MNQSYDRLDQDLLLMSQKELGFARATYLRILMALSPGIKARYEAFVKVTPMVRRAIRQEPMHASGSQARSTSLLHQPISRRTLVTAVVILLAALAFSMWMNHTLQVRAAEKDRLQTTTVTASHHCAPGPPTHVAK